MGPSISQKEVNPGDLVFFKKKGRVFHVSIITDASPSKLWVVHSTTSKGVIKEDIMASRYWREKIYKIISLAELKTQSR
jgi:cell wall-associated NlpC family hydrolase